MFRSTQILRTAFTGLKIQQAALIANKNIARNSSVTTWNKDWKPGPYPKTKEERLAAAKKYNLIPEDYEPYPEEEGYGDYPMFKNFHMESLNPHEPYDYPTLKRNYGEPVHPDVDISLEDKVNFQTEHEYSPLQQILIVVSAVTLYCAIVLAGEYYPMNQCMVPKQYPEDKRVYYSFEADE